MPPNNPDPFQQWLIDHLMEMGRSIESIKSNQDQIKLLAPRLDLVEEKTAKVANRQAWFSGLTAGFSFAIEGLHMLFTKH